MELVCRSGQAARKKWGLQLLLDEAYWKIRRPKGNRGRVSRIGR
jgi:hypothetical protein